MFCFSIESLKNKKAKAPGFLLILIPFWCLKCVFGLGVITAKTIKKILFDFRIRENLAREIFSVPISLKFRLKNFFFIYFENTYGYFNQTKTQFLERFIRIVQSLHFLHALISIKKKSYLKEKATYSFPLRQFTESEHSLHKYKLRVVDVLDRNLWT